MPGMPSARGVEWKGREGSHDAFQKGFDNIPRNPDGTMVVDPKRDPDPPAAPKPPKCCNECTLIGNCDASCAHGSEQCRRMLGI